MATCVSVYHLWSWKHVLSCLKQFIFLLRAKAVKRLCHCSANFPCKSDSKVSAWQPPPLTLLKSWTKGTCLQMSTCGFTWQFGMWVSGWICMYYQCQPHLICRWHLVSLVWGILWYRLCCLNTDSPQRGWKQGDSSTNTGPRASQRQGLTRQQATKLDVQGRRRGGGRTDSWLDPAQSWFQLPWQSGLFHT